MKKIFTIALGVFFLVVQGLGAEETIPEKAAKTGNDVKRSVKKGAHRAEETIKSPDEDAKTRAKIKNRAQEAQDSTVDKGKEIKNKID